MKNLKLNYKFKYNEELIIRANKSLLKNKMYLTGAMFPNDEVLHVIKFDEDMHGVFSMYYKYVICHKSRKEDFGKRIRSISISLFIKRVMDGTYKIAEYEDK